MNVEAGRIHPRHSERIRAQLEVAQERSAKEFAFSHNVDELRKDKLKSPRRGSVPGFIH